MLNFIQIIKQIFPTQPTLDEFIEAHDPQSVYDVEMLERQYEEQIRGSYHSGMVIPWRS